MGLPENRNAFFNKINKLKFKGVDKNRLKLLTPPVFKNTHIGIFDEGN